MTWSRAYVCIISTASPRIAGSSQLGVGLRIVWGRKSERVAQNGRTRIKTPRPTEGAVRADERSLGVSSCVVWINTETRDPRTSALTALGSRTRV